MSDPEDRFSIVELMQDVLTTVNSVFEQAGETLPARQYLAMGGVGETAHDCEQVTVSLEGFYPGTPGEPESTPHICNSPRSATLVVEVVRCVPVPMVSKRQNTISLPTPEKQTAAAERQAIDSFLLLEAGLLAGQERGLGMGTSRGSVASVVAGSVSGEYQAIILTIDISI